jgi:hypothetical protein
MPDMSESHPTTAESWLKRRRKWIALVVAVLAAWGTIWAVYAYHLHRIKQELVEAEAEADGLDPGWRLEELEARRKVVPDEQNGALKILAAHKLLPHMWPTSPEEAGKDPDDPDAASLDVDNVLHWQSPEVQLNAQQTAQLRAKLEQASDALAEASKLIDLPDGRFPSTYGPDPTRRNYDSEAARTISFLLAANAVLHTQDSNLDHAVVNVRGCLNACRCIGDEPSANVQLIRFACRSIGLVSLERIMGQGEPAETLLRDLQLALQDEETQPLVLIALRGERASENRLFTFLEQGDLSFAQTEGAAGPPSSYSERLDDYFKKQSLPRKHAATLRLLNLRVEIAKLPLEQQEAQEALLAARKLPGVDVSWFPSRYRGSQALLRSAIASIAVERYRRENNRWPGSLGDLVPTHLAEVPLDPFDGNPLRYRINDDHIVVYSIGPDHKDDGGHIDRNKKFDVPGTDIGIRLWNVNQRRQPPKP